MGRISDAMRLAGVTSPADAERRIEGIASPWTFGEEGVGAPAPAPIRAPLLDIRPREAGSGFSAAWSDRLVHLPDADPVLVDQFRRLGAAVFQHEHEEPLKVVMVTSANPADGKTLTALNLALVLSESFRCDVLLIDADLRRRVMSDISGAISVPGLSEALQAVTDERLAVVPLTARLSLLPAGRPDPDPIGGLASSRMKRILAEAEKRFDFVVVDAPPVNAVADVTILAQMMQATLLVIRAGHTPYAAVDRAIGAIGRERILGVVLNASEEVSREEYGGGYEDYYFRPAEA